ncbi:hypothetical protein Mmc1_0091 [Magnetococcus marinus MC-1]|uniref:Uncharacterized protein n=1 Tax=Magnetococcus marinus (strain ATCC BAA-1437 / JCM 17883 / MC-1) TaxID=156889 RepID=A0L3S7_MAGMM|nr:hypothetical protein [Magnetococcus marinus]ABK42620.1 hypothetical protein Mmc1_0091 [Magnetococcus marinus MC-1]
MTHAMDIHGARVYDRLSRPAAPQQNRVQQVSDAPSGRTAAPVRDQVTISASVERVTDAIDTLVADTLDNMPGRWDARIEREALEQSMISLRLGTLYA